MPFIHSPLIRIFGRQIPTTEETEETRAMTNEELAVTQAQTRKRLPLYPTRL